MYKSEIMLLDFLILNNFDIQVYILDAYDKFICVINFILFYFFEMWSLDLVAQTGVQWHNLGSPQTPSPGFK